ncbi:hypothetical protein [Croceivirga sp. JEA036]|uniref:hypothetical protein n=1 Tax=Croceivirga sp. JEA036 TaxID=2721162 RepID=UPI00143B0392|nr:hypothetical protein [Croceivirga sp. JEA036]NJB37297.1 hypothetical protein [Croceivirga sp. JEA036]
MKKILKKLTYASLFFMALAFTSCQEEFEEIGNQEEQQAIEVGSNTALLIENTSANDGSFDNIVDGSSCIAVQFPYTVAVAGVEITIDSIADLKVIEELFDEVDTDDDLLEIFFPVTVTLSDFTEVVIENKEALRELAADCLEGGDDDDIECIDFVYPITLFTFDVQNQQSGSVTVNSDREMRLFFKDKTLGELVSIDFPITLKKADGTTLEVVNNAGLAAALSNAKDECDEDDDNDYNDDDFEDNSFVEYLTSCEWVLKEIVRNGGDQTGQYLEFIFEFDDEGVVEVEGMLGNSFAGEWSLAFTEDGPKILMAFDTNTDFSLEWRVYELEEGIIKFYSDNDNKMVLRRACTDNTICDITNVAANLSGCKWRIADASWDIDFDGLIDFSNFNIHAYQNSGAFVDEGNWELTQEGKFKFNALFSANLEGLLGEWSVLECEPGSIKLGNADNAYVVLEKDCEFELPSADRLATILQECSWVIQRMKQEGARYNRYLGYEFLFNANGTVTLEAEAEVVSEGNWELGFNASGQLAIVISMMAEQELNFEWPLVEMLEQKLTFKIEETGKELTIQRVCEQENDEDVQSIRTILMSGLWNITELTEGDMVLTANHSDFDFDFKTMHQVELSINQDPITAGLWRNYRDYPGDLRMALNFEADVYDLGVLSEAWYITEVSENRIKMVYENEETVKVVVFEKKP